MAFPKYKDLEYLKSISEIDKKIILEQKQLLNLKLEKSANTILKIHLFKTIKRRIAQLKYKRALLAKI